MNTEEYPEHFQGILKRVSWKSICLHFGLSFKERKTGAIMAQCVFHREKTPSLRMWPESGTFLCFGCHKRGNKAKFLAEMLRIKPEDLAELSLVRLEKHYFYDPRQLELHWYLLMHVSTNAAFEWERVTNYRFGPPS